MSFKVCIPTAGIGSRLGPHTKYINKALISVSNRPVISHIIEKFPKDAEFVIALGYKGNLVRDYLDLAHPDRIFYFCEVSPYDGPGSGLGLSLISCKDYLNEPFVFISCDTLVLEEIPAPCQNWIGYAPVNELSQYRTVSVEKDRVVEIFEKHETGKDVKAYIGLAGIHDYQLFWESMLNDKKNAIPAGEAHGLRKIIDKKIIGYEFTWYDTGTIPGLENARDKLKEVGSPNVLDKPNEAIWFVNGIVIKFSDDKQFIQNRVKRSRFLKGYVPEIFAHRTNMYAYRKVQGEVVSKIATSPLFENLLKYSGKFWVQKDLKKSSEGMFKEKCIKFYKDKTQERVSLFYRKSGKTDRREIINDEPTDKLEKYLSLLDWNWISNGLPGRFHGDFHFENILWSAEFNSFIFLDWRQEFGGMLEVGDIYYDFAKLLHGLIISHELIAKEQYWIEWGEDRINYDFHRKQVLVECEAYFYKWLKKNGYDLKKVKVLTSLIYLNIAGLHHYPYCLLLYALGKKMLKRELEGGRGIS